VGEGEQQRERGGRHRPAHGVRRVGDENAARGHCRHVDGIEAHAMARDELHAQVGRGEHRRRHPRRRDVDRVVARGFRRTDRVDALREVFPFELPDACRDSGVAPNGARPQK
jgi:hypothetical protein